MVRKLAGFCAAASLVLASTPAFSCSQTPVDASVKVRELQSVLMVSALQCRNVEGLNMLERYNGFIAQQRAALQSHNGQLRAWFIQTSGRAGLNAFDSFTTRLANAHSAGANNADFCATMAQVMQAATAVSAAELPQFALAALPESAACLKD